MGAYGSVKPKAPCYHDATMSQENTLSREEWLQALRDATKREFGEATSPDLDGAQERLATALHTTMSYDLPLDEEPYFAENQRHGEADA